MSIPLLFSLFAGCPAATTNGGEPARDAAASPVPAAPAGSDAGAGTETLDACLDRLLAAASLNRYGDPLDTMYAGGTPLFDERTGERRSRVEHVRARRPDLVAQCEQR